MLGFMVVVPDRPVHLMLLSRLPTAYRSRFLLLLLRCAWVQGSFLMWKTALFTYSYLNLVALSNFSSIVPVLLAWSCASDAPPALSQEAERRCITSTSSVTSLHLVPVTLSFACFTVFIVDLDKPMWSVTENRWPMKNVL